MLERTKNRIKLRFKSRLDSYGKLKQPKLVLEKDGAKLHC